MTFSLPYYEGNMFAITTVNGANTGTKEGIITLTGNLNTGLSEYYVSVFQLCFNIKTDANI